MYVYQSFISQFRSIDRWGFRALARLSNRELSTPAVVSTRPRPTADASRSARAAVPHLEPAPEHHQAARRPASNSLQELLSLASYNARLEPCGLTELVANPIALTGFEGSPQSPHMPASNSLQELLSLASYNARLEPRGLTELVATPIALTGFEGSPHHHTHQTGPPAQGPVHTAPFAAPPNALPCARRRR